MTSSQNKKYIRLGLICFSVFLFSLFSVINRAELGLNFLSSYSAIVVVLLSALGFATFILLFILGVFPHFIRLDKDLVATEREKSNPIYFFEIED